MFISNNKSMGDNFFKIFFFAMFGLLGLVGLITVLRWEKESKDYKDQRMFIESRGAADIPDSWKGKIGGGI